MSAASRPIRNPPLQRACRPFERSAIVAYKPSPIFRMEAKPLSASGCLAIRGSSSIGSASTGRGSAKFEAAYSAPSDVAAPRNFRRENEFEKLFMGISRKSQGSILVSLAPGNEHLVVQASSLRVLVATRSSAL